MEFYLHYAIYSSLERKEKSDTIQVSTCNVDLEDLNNLDKWWQESTLSAEEFYL